MKILLLSNMFPSKQHQYFGIFVKRIHDFLAQRNQISLSVIQKARNGNKLLQYGKWLIKSVIYSIFVQPDVIYAHFIKYSIFPVVLMPRFLKKRVVFNFHGTDYLIEGIWLQLARKLLNYSPLIIVPSSYFKELVVKKFRCQKDRVFVSPSGGVDTTLFTPDTSKTTRFRIGYVSSITEEKGWETLFDAIADINVGYSLEVIFIGSGPGESQLKAKISNYQGDNKYNFYGRITGQTLVDMYRSFDLFIFPSFSESLGLVGIEAMACGVPVIGSNIGGISSYVRDSENGFLFNVGDARDLKNKILSYLSLNSELQNRMRIAARETALHFNSQLVLSDLEQKLLEVIK